MLLQVRLYEGVITRCPVIDDAVEERRHMHTTAPGPFPAALVGDFGTVQQPLWGGRKGVLARLRIHQQATVLQRHPALRINHRVIVAVPARLATDHVLRIVQMYPDVLQFVEVLDVPVPPDGVLNNPLHARCERHVTRERR